MHHSGTQSILTKCLFCSTLLPIKNEFILKIFFLLSSFNKEDYMSHNPTSAMVLALILGVCSVGFATTPEESKPANPETTVVADNSVTPGMAKATTDDAQNVLASHEETIACACGDLSNEPHDFDFDLDDTDDDNDDI
jgi:hypothetical protein